MTFRVSVAEFCVVVKVLAADATIGLWRVDGMCRYARFLYVIARSWAKWQSHESMAYLRDDVTGLWIATCLCLTAALAMTRRAGIQI